MSSVKNGTFKHYCQCCGKELSPILWDLRLISIDGKQYQICIECCEIGLKNGTITK